MLSGAAIEIRQLGTNAKLLTKSLNKQQMQNCKTSARTAAQQSSKCSLLLRPAALAAILLLAAVFSSCNNEPEHRVWYGNNGMKVESKSTNDKQYGKWKYIVRDNFGQILIRSNEEWNVGDTLWMSTHSR